MKNIGATHENLDQLVYLHIRQMITDRALLPGDKIPQEKLAADLGVSRTPLINALKFLEKEKLVQAKPRRGFFVRQFTRNELISIFELREVLEGLAARRAASGITKKQTAELKNFFRPMTGQGAITDRRRYADEDRRFHLYIATIGSHEFLKSILESFNIISFSYQQISSDGLVREPDQTIDEHLAIIDAICSGSAEAAEAAMRRHFRRSIRELYRRDHH